MDSTDRNRLDQFCKHILGPTFALKPAWRVKSSWYRARIVARLEWASSWYRFGSLARLAWTWGLLPNVLIMLSRKDRRLANLFCTYK